MSRFAERFREEGMQQGLQQGMQQGIQQGMQQGEARVLERLLRMKFGELPDTVSPAGATRTALVRQASDGDPQ